MKIFPAIIPETFEDLESRLLQVKGLVRSVQIDICDGRLTPSTSWPYAEDRGELAEILEQQRGLPLWEHFDFEFDLMVLNPSREYERWIDAGATRIIFHYKEKEAVVLKELMAKTRERGVEAGLALHLSDPVETIEAFKDVIDSVQFMGIERIGFQGEAFDPRVLLSAVQTHYGAMPRSVIPVEDVQPEPPQTEERRARIDQPTPTQKLAIGYHGPALGDFDHAPLVLLNEILLGGRSSRVHRALVQQQEIASDVRGWVGSFRDPGLYDVFLGARAEHTGEELLAAYDAIIDEVKRTPIEVAELDKVKARLELGSLQGLETVAGKAEQIGFYETVLGDPAALFHKLEAYRRVTPGDLLRVARRYLVAESRTVIEVFPDGSDDDDDDDETDDDGAGV
mgnify:CR=1 FL=1